jgi:hypothetical protein
MTGSEFAKHISNMSIIERESAMIKEVLSGNIPSFSRNLKPVILTQKVNGKTHKCTFYATCDYLAIGSDSDYFYIPMTPSTAQYLAEKLQCSLPTSKMVDMIYAQADIKLKPQPIPPSNAMVTVPVFKQHTDSIRQQIDNLGLNRSADNNMSGHKKDIVISNKIYDKDNPFARVVIYGWHLGEGNPIQPPYSGHIASYADYSHGVRLISKNALMNEEPFQIVDILKDTELSSILSNEGVIDNPSYPLSNYNYLDTH